MSVRPPRQRDSERPRHRTERAAALQNELDERARSDRKLTHDASLAQAG